MTIPSTGNSRSAALRQAYMSWTCAGLLGAHRAYADRRWAVAWFALPFVCTALLLSEAFSLIPLNVIYAAFAYSIAEGLWLWSTVEQRPHGMHRPYDAGTISAYAIGVAMLACLAPGLLILSLEDLLGAAYCLCSHPCGVEVNMHSIPVRFLAIYEHIPLTKPLARWLHATWWLRPECKGGEF